MNLDRKYFNLVEELGLSPVFWMLFAFAKWLIVTFAVLCFTVATDVPMAAVGVIFFLSQTMIELYPKGYFENQEAGPQSVIMFTERLAMAVTLGFGYQAFFALLLPFRTISICAMWGHVWFYRRNANLKTWDREAVQELIWNIRTYLPVGLINTAILQVPIWLGGLVSDPQAMARLAVLQQSLQIPRQLSTIVTRLFHNWMQAGTVSVLLRALGLAAVSVAVSLSLFAMLAIAMGAKFSMDDSLMQLHALWSFQIILTLFIAKRMSLFGQDRSVILGALVGLALSVPTFWLLTVAEFEPVASYVLAIAGPHLVGVLVSWYLGVNRE